MSTAPALTSPAVKLDPDLLDVEGLARLFGVSRDTIERRKDSFPPGFRLGRKTVWSRAAILDHIKSAGQQK